MQSIVDFLHGKKVIILGITFLIDVLLVKEHVIDVNIGATIQGILTLLGASADVATQKLGVSPQVNSY